MDHLNGSSGQFRIFRFNMENIGVIDRGVKYRTIMRYYRNLLLSLLPIFFHQSLSKFDKHIIKDFKPSHQEI